MSTFPPTLFLASTSPRRLQLATLLGLRVQVVDGSIDESAFTLADPIQTAVYLARMKARKGKSAQSSTSTVLAADTIVAYHDQPLGKPATEQEALQTLESLSGERHYVTTAVSLLGADGAEWGAFVTTAVHMRSLTREEIQRYIDRGEPFDKAGGYAVQDQEFRPVNWWQGCYLNIVGLPLCAVQRGLATLGVHVPSTQEVSAPPCHFCEEGAPLVAVGRR